MKQKIDDIVALGYTKEEVIKITKSFPSIYGYSIETMKQKIEGVMSLGYTKEEVIKMTKTIPQIYSYSIETMKQKIDDIVELGYTKEEVIKMTKTFPPIYGLFIENMKQKIDDIVALGYTKEDVIKMTKLLPSIYGLSIENIKQKIEFYDSINMHFLAVEDSKKLMQSTKKSYARYKFLTIEKGIIIDTSNYKKIFYDEKNFQKQHGISTDELCLKYNYEKDMEEQEFGGKK